MQTHSWDVIVVGGGPAGLSAALLLGRCRRRVCVFDDGRPRNAAAHASHGFFTRDGTAPRELRELGRAQLEAYKVACFDDTVAHACVREGRFEIETAQGALHRARKLLLATGVVDSLPEQSGFAECFGKSVFQCPYCDGWEQRERAIAVYGKGAEGVELALSMTVWSQDIVYCSDDARPLPAVQARALRLHGIQHYPQRILELQHRAGELTHIAFEGHAPVAREAVFVHAGTEQRSELPGALGCDMTEQGAVDTGDKQDAQRGVYVAGDAARDTKLLAMAVAEGTKAAIAINRALRLEDSEALLSAAEPR